MKVVALIEDPRKYQLEILFVTAEAHLALSFSSVVIGEDGYSVYVIHRHCIIVDRIEVRATAMTIY